MNIVQNMQADDLISIKRSFFYVYHNFLDDPQVSKDIVGCLFKWAIQLEISEEDLEDYMHDEEHFKVITDKKVIIGHLFNLVYMIYLDNVVEDIELKVLSSYAERVGLKPFIVNDILKTIVTAPDDGADIHDVKKQLLELLENEINL